jgi:hypothetical protein
MTMRPKTIATAEALFMASLVLLLLGSILTWRTAVATLGQGTALGSVLAVIVLPLLLLLLATRKRSRVGLWLFTAWTVFSVWGVSRQVADGSRFELAAGLTVAQVALMVACVALLFARSARRWFAGDVPTSVEQPR